MPSGVASWRSDLTTKRRGIGARSLLISGTGIIAFNLLHAITLGADVIVLGCTHYHWIEEDIAAMANGQAAIMQPEQAIIKQLTRVLARQQ